MGIRLKNSLIRSTHVVKWWKLAYNVLNKPAELRPILNFIYLTYITLNLTRTLLIFKVRDETAVKFLTSMINTITKEGTFERAGSHMYVTRVSINRTLINSEF
jgi:hypothetical protein